MVKNQQGLEKTMGPTEMMLLAGAVGAVAGAGLAWAAAVLRWNRLSLSYRQQLKKSEQARQFAQQQGDQARRQVDGLQQELADLRQRLAHQQQAQAEPELDPDQISDEELLLQASRITDWESEEPDGDGFAKTQMIMPRRR
jgi:hypothetical protein